MPFPTDFPSFKELARQADAGLFRTICSNPDMSSGIILLVQAFVTSRIDCCCSLLAGLPLGTLGRLDRVLRSAARLVGGLSKFSSITAYMRDVLHWLPISERIQYRITAMVSRCVLGCA